MMKKEKGSRKKLEEPGYLKRIAELRQVCKIAFDKGLIDTHSGNISIGLGKNLLITKTGRSLINLKPQDFTAVSIIKPKKGDKDGGASSEINIHRFILKSFPDSTVFHSHPLNAIALSLSPHKNMDNNKEKGDRFKSVPFFLENLYKKYPELDEITPLDFESTYFFPKIYVFPLNLIEDIKTNNLKTGFEAKDIFKENGVFMIKSHGSFAWGKTPLDALRWTIMLEASAKIILKRLSL
ncbi:MAG: class II aldolase/adducin family protein [Deltaproteobacteria bacterium]|jgi:L-fuculose-phosphate aldolase|nr:class II aldolase/adducin family protein [Deltaproteobacteria bacterium]MCL5879545.1 class II aldolase/adducin family protein [Deltaproteobacteria bacterium]